MQISILFDVTTLYSLQFLFVGTSAIAPRAASLKLRRLVMAQAPDSCLTPYGETDHCEEELGSLAQVVVGRCGMFLTALTSSRRARSRSFILLSFCKFIQKSASMWSSGPGQKEIPFMPVLKHSPLRPMRLLDLDAHFQRQGRLTFSATICKHSCSWYSVISGSPSSATWVLAANFCERSGRYELGEERRKTFLPAGDFCEISGPGTPGMGTWSSRA